MKVSETTEIEIFRYLPDKYNEPFFKSYEVPYREDWVVLDAINYINIHRIAQHLVEGTATNLLEALAELIASKILKNEPAEAVRVQIYKLSPYLGSASQGIAGVEIYRAKRN